MEKEHKCTLRTIRPVVRVRDAEIKPGDLVGTCTKCKKNFYEQPDEHKGWIEGKCNTCDRGQKRGHAKHCSWNGHDPDNTVTVFGGSGDDTKFKNLVKTLPHRCTEEVGSQIGKDTYEREKHDLQVNLTTHKNLSCRHCGITIYLRKG